MYKTLGKEKFFNFYYIFVYFVLFNAYQTKIFLGDYSWEALYKNMDSDACPAPEPIVEPKIFSDDGEKTVAQTAQEFQLALSSIKQVNLSIYIKSFFNIFVIYYVHHYLKLSMTHYLPIKINL